MIELVQIKPSPGELIALRGREWVVLPSVDDDLVLLKPLGGSDAEITGIYLPLNAPEDKWKKAVFPEPQLSDINDFETAKLLFDASRLSFRNAAGPFRCMGKLSFRPRSYQILPLVMALQLPVIRLLIADDVGIGKTIEALIILKEMMERGEVKRFAVICQPHLCEQWQSELKDKLDIHAEIIRSGTISAIERKLIGSESVFKQLPYQVISIDYVKNDKRKPSFLTDCPEFIIVDEAHTAALPKGSSSVSQQQRYHLLHQLAKDDNRHLLLLTATPHSGKNEEFRSLFGLLKGEFETLDFDNLLPAKRKQLAKHFIQRKRENIRRWLNQDTPFPDRDTSEIGYKLHPAYSNFFKKAQAFARGLTADAESSKGAKGKYWAALALLRGIMSSPAAGLEMLVNKIQKQQAEDDERIADSNPVIERLEDESDAIQAELLAQANLNTTEQQELADLYIALLELNSANVDRKAETALTIIKDWIFEGFQPIIFCKYIATASYLGAYFKGKFSDAVDVQVITSMIPDEQRKEKIAAMSAAPRHLLIATDCLSEGINLQDQFNAVLHYDLPWNPNRLEQREGRVDRFGQTAPVVKTALIWGEDNPIDAIVLKVLIRKVRDIQKATGVSISLGEDNHSIMDAVLMEVLLEPEKALQHVQMEMDFGDESYQLQLTNELETAKKRAENLRSIFAHESIKPELIENDLKAVDEAIGDMQSVEHIVTSGVRHLSGEVKTFGKGHKAYLQNLPAHLRKLLPGEQTAQISFDSPTPPGYHYVGRNHPFTEQLCQYLLSLAFEEKNGYQRIARASVIQTESVKIKTTIIQFRVRNVIKEVMSKMENISEEMYLWGFEGSTPEGKILEYSECKNLLFSASSSKQLSLERQQDELRYQLDLFAGKKEHFLKLAEERANVLLDAHGRFKALVGGRRYEAVYPILPPDILGIYVFIPNPKI